MLTDQCPLIATTVLYITYITVETDQGKEIGCFPAITNVTGRTSINQEKLQFFVILISRSRSAAMIA